MVSVWQIMDDLPNLPNFPAIQYIIIYIYVATRGRMSHKQ